MATSNLNIRMDRDIKEQADQLFNELGLTMTAAVNLFLRASIREQGIPFSLKLDKFNKETIEAIEEGRKIAKDPNAKGYRSVDELKKALEL
jgi:addiction module antitoxin, relB/dinJ family